MKYSVIWKSFLTLVCMFFAVIAVPQNVDAAGVEGNLRFGGGYATQISIGGIQIGGEFAVRWPWIAIVFQQDLFFGLWGGNEYDDFGNDPVFVSLCDFSAISSIGIRGYIGRNAFESSIYVGGGVMYGSLDTAGALKISFINSWLINRYIGFGFYVDYALGFKADYYDVHIITGGLVMRFP